MKKIIVMIFLMIVAVLLLISGVIQYTTMQAAAAMNVFDRSVQDAMRNGCAYSTDPHIFSSRVERLRSLVSTQIHTDHVNAALGILEHDAAEKADDVIAFFKRYRESEYPVEALIQAYYYSADYLQWLEENNLQHSLSMSRRYQKEDLPNYAYYLDVISTFTSDCGYFLTDDEWITPFPFPFTITADYMDSAYLDGQAHYGIDLSQGYGAEAYAVTSGKVIDASDTCAGNGGYLGNTCGGKKGNYVVIETDSKPAIYITYMHLQRVAVKKGQTVTAGKLIGYQGNSGNSTGSHLHLELRLKNGIWSGNDGVLNPHFYIDFYERSEEKNE